jgi:hypothetical protein
VVANAAGQPPATREPPPPGLLPLPALPEAPAIPPAVTKLWLVQAQSARAAKLAERIATAKAKEQGLSAALGRLRAEASLLTEPAAKRDALEKQLLDADAAAERDRAEEAHRASLAEAARLLKELSGRQRSRAALIHEVLSNVSAVNSAVGGQWPGSPDSTTTIPQQMLIDYVRVYRPAGTAL